MGTTTVKYDDRFGYDYGSKAIEYIKNIYGENPKKTSVYIDKVATQLNISQVSTVY